jgi:hypothetical protein
MRGVKIPRRPTLRQAVPHGVVVLASLTITVMGCYDYSLPVSKDAEPDGNDGGDLVDAGGDAAAFRCTAGRFSCGGNLLPGPPDRLFRCTGDGTGTLAAKCANGCIVRPPGTNDECNAPSACTTGGAYCGGDKINGEPDVLYRCAAGGATTVLERCKNGCSINTGRDDACK